MIKLIITGSVEKLKDYDTVHCECIAEKTYWVEVEDHEKYEVEFTSEAVYIATEMSNIEVVDRTVTISIPTEVWDVLRGI